MRRIWVLILVVAVASCKKQATIEKYTFFGDSHIERWNVAEYFPVSNTTNKGKSGALIKETAKVVEAVAANETGACIIEVGTNDLRTSIGRQTSDSLIAKNFIADYTALLTLATIRFKKIYVIEVLPTAKFYLNGSAPLYLLINQQLKTLCRSYTKVEFISVYDILANTDNYLEPAFTQDGLHLNNMGYEFFSKKLRGYLY